RLARETCVAQPEECFTVGLLLDVGALALASVFPSEYASLLTDHAASTPAERMAAERSQFGIAHGELSAAMMEDWRLPDVYVDAVRRCVEASAPADGTRVARIAATLAGACRLALVCAGE